MRDDLPLRVDAFAGLMVLVEDPFGSREAALAGWALDEAGYRGLVEAWRERLGAGPRGQLRGRAAVGRPT